jgi:hypothetical protein
MSTMNWKLTLIGIAVLLTPVIYAAIGIVNTLHAFFGN